MTAIKPRVLLVEDDDRMAEMTSEVLLEGGYEVVHFIDANSALEWLKINNADIVVSDIGLPGISGIQFCALIRDTARIAGIPILMLTAQNDEFHKVTALRKGADDYMVKPFSNNELVARVEALLRRCRHGGQMSRVLDSGGLSLDLDTGCVMANKELLHLLPKEYALLVMFLQHKGRIISWERIRDSVWGLDAIATRDTIKVTIHRLKAHLGPYAGCIEPVLGMGYRWTAK